MNLNEHLIKRNGDRIKRCFGAGNTKPLYLHETHETNKAFMKNSINENNSCHHSGMKLMPNQTPSNSKTLFFCYLWFLI